MFAPQTINIRYGDNGLLGQAAFSAGAGLRQRQDMGNAMQFAQNQVAQMNASAEAGAQADLQAKQLQMAQELQQARIRATPTSGTYERGNGSPLTSSLIASKNLSRTTALAGMKLDDTQSAQLDALERDPNTPLSTYEGLVNKIRSNADASGKATEKTQASADEIEAKKRFVQQIAPSIKNDVLPEEGHGLWQMALDPHLSMNEMRLQANLVAKNIASRKESATQQQQKTAALQQAVSSGAVHPDDVATIQAGVNDPKVTTQQFISDVRASGAKKSLEARQAINRQIRGINSQRVQAEKDAAQIESQNKGFIDFTGDESQFGPKDTQYANTFKQWKAKKAEADTLAQKAEALANVGAGPDYTSQSTQPPPGSMLGLPQGQSDIVRVNNPAEAAALASGTVFADPNGKVWTKR